ncbi:unnamed protein product [Knipowitschia caucasica]
MATNWTWKLKRFARYTPAAKDKHIIPWKVYESVEKAPIHMTILDTGYLIVMRGQESLETVHLISSADTIKVHKKNDNLLFRFNLKGESRLTRLQFQSKSKDDAFTQTGDALKIVMEYLPLTCLEDAPQPPYQTHPESSAQVIQSGDNVGKEYESVQGLLPIKKLAQHFLGDINLILPELYHHSHLAPGDLEPILRVFLLDPSFSAFVEKVEGELKTLVKQ